MTASAHFTDAPLLLVGIDAGGTAAKIQAQWADSYGGTLPLLRRGAANLNREGVEAVAATLAGGIVDAISEAVREREAAAERYRLRVAAGVAGAANAEPRQMLASGLGQLLRAAYHLAPERLHLATDADLVLEAATHGGAGLVAIAGTGSIVLARSADGQTYRAGGWGYLLGDEGGGYALGRRALRAALAAWEGGPATLMTELLAQREGFDDRDAVVAAVYREGWPPSKAAPVLFAAADAGDVVALAVLAEETDALAAQVARLAAQLPQPTPAILRLAGGLGDEPSYRAALVTSLAAQWPGGTLAEQPVEPIEGALWLAAHA